MTAAVVSVSIMKSNKPGKRFVAVFRQVNGKTKTTHFGAANPTYGTFIDHKSEARKRAYLARHKVNENWSNPYSAGSLSRYILWNKPTLAASIADYKRRFGFSKLSNSI